MIDTAIFVSIKQEYIYGFLCLKAHNIKPQLNMEINKLKIVFFLRSDRMLTNNESPIYIYIYIYINIIKKKQKD